jgi:hypothetical protein
MGALLNLEQRRKQFEPDFKDAKLSRKVHCYLESLKLEVLLGI